VLGGTVKDLLLLDVTPLSLGIETLGGVMTKLIERTPTIPVRKSEVFTTASDSQPSVEIHVLQGEREMAGDNRTLGRFHLDGIRPGAARRAAGRGDLRHRRERDSPREREGQGDAEGAEDHDHRVDRAHKDEIDNMVKQAESHAERTGSGRRAIEARNHLDSLVYNTEKTLKEHRDKVPAETAAKVEAALAEAKEALKSEDEAVLKAASEKLIHESPRPRGAHVQAGVFRATGGSSGRGKRPGRGRPRGRRRRRGIRGSREEVGGLYNNATRPGGHPAAGERRRTMAIVAFWDPM